MSNPNLQFYELTVAAVKRETSEAVSVALQIPTELKELFRFKAGQYLTFKFNINGEELRRSYSLCSSPNEELYAVAVKQVEGGRVSTYINTQLQVGEKVWCMPPMGNFTVQSEPAAEKHYVAFAAGSGITPVISILKTTLAQEVNSRFTLFYVNKTNASIIFKNELDALVITYAGRLKIQHLLSRESTADPLFEGRINGEKCKTLVNADLSLLRANEFFLCGPEGMIKEVTDTLQSFGVNKDKIRFELFTASAEPVSPVEIPAKEVFNGTANVTIILDDEETAIELSQDGSTVLEAAMDAGVDAPFSCQGGVCATCRAKVTSGKTVMDSNMALTDEEVEEGYILTCQAHPASANVVVNYDEAY